ncbi:MAG: nitronate monooxygenase [Marinobacter sp.]
MSVFISVCRLWSGLSLSAESGANANYRSVLKSDRCRNTQITSAISGRPARGIGNRFHTEINRLDAPAIPDYPIAYDAGKALAAASVARDNLEFSAYWAGQGAPLAREMSAGELIANLVRECGFC